ncbi:hypothetical protein CEXT_519961 [Caerostris extrusa]|uniref:Uncharacterized protein n=1 Tax=Caerostris extrusa TaxID=172846 RepID=A0AAV4X6G2_CAEEX|nr:hypothetical protein CEXT_519961 [Caerostris extrusa]
MCLPHNCPKLCTFDDAKKLPSTLFESGYSRHCAAGGNLLLSKQSPAMTATFVSFRIGSRIMTIFDFPRVPDLFGDWYECGFREHVSGYEQEDIFFYLE